MFFSMSYTALCSHTFYIFCLQLLPRLQEVVQRREEAGNPIDVKLKQVADELHSIVVSYLQVGSTWTCSLGMYAEINIHYCLEFQMRHLYFRIVL
jgi:hypothetical protein